MTSADLLHRTNMTLESIQDSLYRFQVSNCVNKLTINRINQQTGQNERTEVPCGKCFHCKNTYKNEWFTRMSLHSEYYPYVYFITFTYASPDTASSVGVDYYSDGINTKRLCVGPQYQAALLHMYETTNTHLVTNAYNSAHVSKSFPALLNQKHMQNMLKVLRKLITNGAQLSYYYVGEYGHKYGHPHYHMILWSDKAISNLYNKVRRAWSRAYCFTDDPCAVSPYRGQKNVHVFRCPFGHVDFVDMVANGSFERTDASSAKSVFGYVCKYLMKDDYTTTQVDDFYNKLPLQSDTYNNEIIQKEHEQDLYTITEFRKKVSPYTRCSNRCPIGRDYALAHLQEFTQHATKIPADKQGKSRIFPSYFRKLAKRELFHYFRKETNHGTHSLSYGNMLGIMQNLDLLATCTLPISSTALDENVTGRPYLCGDEIRLPLLSFHDTKNGYNYICCLKVDSGFAECYYLITKYNRSTKRQECFGSLSCKDFLAAYKESYYKLMQYLDFYKSNQIYNKRCLEIFRTRVNNNGFSYEELLNNAYLSFNSAYESHQRLYHLKHESLEL